MANYKIKDLQQAQTLNGAVALEIQDGDSMSTFATLDQIAEFSGEHNPCGVVDQSRPHRPTAICPICLPPEIAAAYDRIVADPIHTVPVVRIPDNGGQYLVPSGYGVHADTKAVIGYYASQTYVLPVQSYVDIGNIYLIETAVYGIIDGVGRSAQQLAPSLRLSRHR